MALPALRLGRPGDKVSYLLDWCARHYVDAYLFDASTDLAVPTVYCLTIAEHDPCLRQVISSGASRSTEQAAEKALLETIYLRVHLAQRRDQAPPADFGSFRGVTDGARYMARPERAEAFAALLDGHAGRASTGPDPLDPNPVTALRQLIAVLSARKMRAFALDRTTPELAAAGLAAVTVVIPELQPMSLQPLLQYRAHARLYEAPPLMGYRAWPEPDLSQWPQPCA
jgi:ribosomal protein S12 methylthiotransferase accessory factor